jgi:serine/threonine protein kinase/tetratricopeptide (TPR) repeat protein
MANQQSTDKTIFLEAVESIPEERWEAFIKERCGDDVELLHRVERLLRAHRELENVPDQKQPAAESTQFEMSTARLGTQIGPYKLREQIGEGGMGVVYVAEQTEPVRRKVALKIIRPGMATRDVVARFEAERQALAMMDHPHVARVFDGGATETGQPFFVMELVQGPPITEYCDARRLNTRQRLELFLKVCGAVQHAHQKGIIHRDLKPSNVLVPEIDGAAAPKVIDFGVAKAVNQKLTKETVYTHFSQMVGTPLYMSPEQAGLGVVDIDTRSDVYSLGVLLYELLTGHTPFDIETLKSADFDEMRRIIREDQPHRPSAKVSTLQAEALSTVAEHHGSDPRMFSQVLRRELDWIVMKCLEKDRNCRYESASALAADVERYLAGDAVEACPPSRMYRLRKFAGRYKVALTTAATIAVLLVAGVVGTTWQMLRAMNAESSAAAATEEARTEAERARAEADRANAEAERANTERQRAIDSLKLARNIVDSLYMKLGTRWIADETAPTNFQQNILATAVKFYEDLSQTQITRPGDLSELSLVSSGYGRIGLIQHYLQNYEDAVAAREKAIGVIQQALTVEPNNPAIHSSVAEVQFELGQSLVELARFGEAMDAYNKSAAAAKQLVDEEFEPLKHRYWVARSDLGRVAVLAKTGSVTDAMGLAQTVKDELREISKQAAGKPPFSMSELRSNNLWADYWLAKSTAYGGDIEAASKLCRTALDRCRRQRVLYQDDARLRTPEIDLAELAAELATLKGDFAAAADQFREVLDMRRESLRSGIAPERFFMESVFNASVNLDGQIEPGPFCGYVETQLRLVQVLRQADRPYSAEVLLGECTTVTACLVAERPNALRYHVADANVLAMASELRADDRPAEAEILYRRARQVWSETANEFPHAKDYVSGVHGLQSDWKYFDELGRRFPELPATETDTEKLNIHETVWHHHANGLSWARAGHWKAAIGEFEKAVALRKDDHAYDWLQLAIAHAKLDQYQKAKEWLDNAEDALTQIAVVHVELAELRDEARIVVDTSRNDEADEAENGEVH